MLIKKVIISSFALALFFSGASNKTLAQMSHQNHTSETSQTFEHLEQPLWLKAAVTASGLGLIGLEIWWFLLSKPKSKKAEAHNGIQ